MSQNPAPQFSRLLDKATQDRLQVMQAAAAAAAAESKAMGLPAFRMQDGRLLYILPDGTETFERPASLVLTEAEEGQL